MNRSLLEDLVVSGLDDWVDEAEVIGNIARRAAEDLDDRFAIAVGLIQTAILRGLVIPGGLTNEGFDAWSLSETDAASQVLSRWVAFDNPAVLPGDVVWLKNTDKGDALGLAALERES